VERLEIIAWTSDYDCFTAATELIHRAYAVHRVRGITFGAATQSVAATRRRIKTSTATWIVKACQNIIGIISYYDCVRFPRTEPKWYARPDASHFGQFAVEPERQGLGIGQRLMSCVEDKAVADQKAQLCCDTASTATRLIAFYEARGFRPVDRHQWPNQDFESVVLSKALR
jgi:ribosomal protein S18 acetylase RimI-like enzyme